MTLEERAHELAMRLVGSIHYGVSPDGVITFPSIRGTEASILATLQAIEREALENAWQQVLWFLEHDVPKTSWERYFDALITPGSKKIADDLARG
jgi:hypothetical protein